MRLLQCLAAFGLLALVGCASSTVYEPLQLRVVSQRTILEVEGAPAFAAGPLQMSLSPDGRHLLFVKRRLADNPEGALSRTTWYDPQLLDTATGEVVTLPFESFPETRLVLEAWLTGTFTADGKYIHVFQPARQGVLYDIANRTERMIGEPGCRNIISDDSAKDIYVTSTQDDLRWWGDWMRAKFVVRVLPMGGGAVEQYSVRGMVFNAINRNRVVVYSVAEEGSIYTIQDLAGGKELRRFSATRMPYPYIEYLVFWVGGRYLCYPDADPFSMNPEGSSTAYRAATRTWDSVLDRVVDAHGCVAVAPGPSPFLMLAFDPQSGSANALGAFVVDVRNGWRWPVPTPLDDRFVCANGKYIVYLREIPDEKKSQLILVELGVK